MSKHKVRFILNPFSGPKKNIDVVSIIQQHINHEIISIDLVYTEYAGHGTLLSKEAADLSYFAVVAVGGDGTINEIASELKNTNTALGVIPFGSGNGLSYHLGIKRDIIHAISIINLCEKALIDTAMINDTFFINVSGIGFDAKVAFMTKLNKKRGFWPYFIQTIKEIWGFRYMKMKISHGDKQWTASYAMVSVANGSMYGYDFSIAPKASIIDGLFDVVLVKKAPIFRYLSLAFRMYFRSLHKSSLVTYFSCPTITIETLDAEYFHVDGEGFRSKTSKYIIKIFPKSLHLLSKP